MFNLDLDFNFEDITFDNIGSWPFLIKLLTICISCLIIYFLCNWIFISSNLEQLRTLKSEEQRQRVFFASKQRSLYDIQDYKQQIGTIEDRLKKLTKKLPAENEVPDLINQISQAGNVSNLSFNEIKILPEKKFKYYVELPISMSIVGNYHQFGEFVSKVSSMSRVITFHDLTIEKMKDIKKSSNIDGGSPSDKLEIVVLAKTYRYLQHNTEQDSEEGSELELKENQQQG